MLEKRRLGRTGLKVSLLGFGGIPIMRVSHSVATRAITEAVKLGIDFIDTARGYGDSESKIGAAIKHLKSRPVIASKSPKRDRDGILSDFAESLSHLGLDYLDIYQIHCVNKVDEYETVMGPGGAYEGLEHLRSEGLIRFIGITSHNLEIIKKAIVCGRFDTVQILFNFLEPEAKDEVIPLARKHDVGIIAMKPLAGGCIEDYELALKFVASEPSVVAVPGMASIHEVRLNVGILSGSLDLSQEEQKRIAEIRAGVGKEYCRRCDYCQPCAQGIPISFALHIESIRKRIGEEKMRSDIYVDLLKKVESCERCGQCEERCPFDLPVMTLISKAAAILSEVLRG